MKFRSIEFLIIVLLSFFYAPILSAAEDVDWKAGKEPTYEADSTSIVTSTRWGVGSRQEDVQITFLLEATPDMSKGGWSGFIQSSERFYVKIFLVGNDDRRQYFKVNNSKAVGSDTYLGGWKDGPATSKEQLLTFDFSWDELMSVKKSKTLILDYASYDSPDIHKDITFSLENFSAELDKIEADIKSIDGGRAYLMTQEQANSTPILDLPLTIQESWQTELQRVSGSLSMSVDALMKLSKNEIELLIKKKSEADKKARLAEIRKQHQAIYDQEPNWIDINICPKPDVSFCKNVGKNAFTDDAMFSDLTHEYGEILGVVWRSIGSIKRIYGGSVEYDFAPKIYYTSYAGYYYIVKNDKGQIDIRACDSVYTKY